MILANSYNENEPTIRDYSNSLNDSIGLTGTTHVADTFGFYLDFNGTTGQYIVDNVLFDSAFSVVTEVYINGSELGTSVIYFKDNNSSLVYHSSGDLDFSIDDGVASHTVSISITKDTYHKVVCTYSNANGLSMYIGDTVATDANTLLLDDSEFLRVGSDQSNFLDGRLREFRVYDTELTADQASTAIAYPQGIDVLIPSHAYQVGDLATEFKYNPQAVVFAVVDSDNIKYLPMSSVLIKDDITTMRVGNRFNTSRQSFFEFDIIAERMCVYDGINEFTDIGNTSNCVVKIDKTGVTGVTGSSESPSYFCQTGSNIIPKACVSTVLTDVLFEMNADGSYSPIASGDLAGQLDLFFEDNGDGTISPKDVTL